MRIEAGDRGSLAMEAEIENLAGEWIYGHFRIWCEREAIGNWDDAVDIRGVIRWLRDLAENPRNRKERSLDCRSKEDVFRLVLDPVIAKTAVQSSVPPIADAFSRFVISHIGMSSFDAYDVLLIEDEKGRQRILWRHGDATIGESTLWPNEIQRVAAEFVEKATAVLVV